MTDEQIVKLPRGGHDYRKVYAAFDAATKHVGQPTVILAKTIKGWTIDALEGKNATHQMKKLTKDDLKKFRDRLYLPISDKRDRRVYERLARRSSTPARTPPRSSTCWSGAASSAARCPSGVVRAKPLKLPGDEVYAELKQGSGKQAIATTMALVRLLRDLMKDPEIGQRIVPIAPDEYRTFGMDSMFPTRQGLQPDGPAATSRSTASCCWPTRSPSRARCCTRASPRPARWRPRRPPARRTPRTAST